MRKTLLLFFLFGITTMALTQIGSGSTSCRDGNIPHGDFCCKRTSGDSLSCTNGACWTCVGDCLPGHVDEGCSEILMENI